MQSSSTILASSSSSTSRQNQNTAHGPALQQPSTPLRPTTDSSGYVLPAIWNFPPFFTQQPNPQTFAHQLSLWTNLLLSFSRHHRIFYLSPSSSLDTSSPLSPLLHNTSINRRILPPFLRLITDQLVSNGQAVADPPKQTERYLIYWRKPEEWGKVVYEWVVGSGLTGGAIMTFYEITEGDIAHTTEFHLLPHPLLRKALETLVKQGKAQIFKGDETGEGVKFF